jgi:Predicted AAA-ATPase/PD-(D/E)XK nuclease superfamily
MIRIGYGKAHFPDLIEDKSHYIDRTDYIERLENLGESYVFFLRPRRFGKSLWVSVLHHYYDIRFKNQFDTLFGNYYIGKHPTPYANKYLVLKFDFSGIDSESKETVFKDFLAKTRRYVREFLTDYNDIFSKEEAKIVLASNSPHLLVDELFSLIRSKKLTSKLYLLIDEYDHFANQLMANQLSDFKEIVSKGGFVRLFYENLKTAAGEGLIQRIFVTGVSPITLDSMTSGFNIATDLSLVIDFHNMMGFTNAEVRNLLELMDVEENELDYYNNLLKVWYDGYKFNPRATDLIYNSDMILYFAAYFNRIRMAPDKMLDTNIASSYNRIRSLFRLPKRGKNEFDELTELLENREVVVKVTQIFNFDIEFTTTDFMSLLFYMGFLTIKKAYGNSWLLQIPNRVIEQLYHRYFVQLLSERTQFARGVDTLEDALAGLIYHNNAGLIANLITHTLKNLLGRDATVPLEIREKNVQVLLFSFLSFSESYLVETEYNAQGQYFDILATNISVHTLDYNFLFELKYLPKASAKTIKAEYAKAEVQIARYQQTPKALAIKNLKSWIMIVVGAEVKICKQV